MKLYVGNLSYNIRDDDGEFDTDNPDVQDALASANEVAEEAISGIRTVRSFTAEQAETARYATRTANAYALAKKRVLAGASFMAAGSFAAHAAAVTGDLDWLAGVDMCVAWFLGDNDSGVRMLDEQTGGGCDGLERDENRPATDLSMRPLGRSRRSCRMRRGCRSIR